MYDFLFNFSKTASGCFWASNNDQVDGLFKPHLICPHYFFYTAAQFVSLSGALIYFFTYCYSQTEIVSSGDRVKKNKVFAAEPLGLGINFREIGRLF